MKKTVRDAIKRIARRVEKETGTDITEYLEDVVEVYEINDYGKPATCTYIIRGLETEADIFVDSVKGR